MLNTNEALLLFRRLLQCDSSNYGNGSGDESAVVQVLAEYFSENDVTYQVVSASPKRPNIIARIKGDGLSDKKALLLSAHLDVVPALNWKEEGWKVDPFGGIEHDGYVYGRGAIDMKHHAAMSAYILVHFKRHKIVLHRDLIFAGVADEEAGSKYGSKFLIEQHPDLIDAEVVLTELGGFPVDVLGSVLYPVQIAEKGTCRIRITARGTGGHSSIPHKDNCIGSISEIASALCKNRLSLRLTPQAIAQIDVMIGCAGYVKGMVLSALKYPYLHDFILDCILPREISRSLEPIFHNIAIPTIIKSGAKDNQVPSTAELIVHCRTLPGCNSSDVINDIRSVTPKLNSDNFDILVEDESPGLSHQTSDDESISSYLDIIEQVIKRSGLSGKVWPVLIPGATDAKFYCRHPNKMICIGFAPFFLNQGEKFTDLFHGINERISTSGFDWGLRILYDVVQEICCRSSG